MKAYNFVKKKKEIFIIIPRELLLYLQANNIVRFLFYRFPIALYWLSLLFLVETILLARFQYIKFVR